MKKILGMAALLLIIGCDDGDMTFQTFDFSNAIVRSCTENPEIIYKVNGTEALILKLSPGSFANTPTGTTPRIVTIGGANTLQYLKFGSDVDSGSNSIICEALPPISPSEIWNANGGTIRIVTVANFEDETDTTIVTGYTHTITIVNASFVRNDETIIIEDNEFGDYKTQLDYIFNFNGTNSSVQQCTIVNTDRLYITNQNEVLQLDLDMETLFPNSTTAPEIPRTQVLNAENEITFIIYSGNGFTENHICNPGDLNNSPSVFVSGSWIATAGSIEVTTTSPTVGQFEHQIKLVNVTFTNTQNSAETFTRNSYLLPPYNVSE